MNRAAARLLPPRLALVADDLLIHAHFRSRLDAAYELICFHDARSALAAFAAFGQTHFDLCLVDIQIPDMDGLALIAAAALVDPTLGFVVLSAFDSESNLRRTVPLQVYDFIWKPLPERDGFEARLPEWIARTRQRRRDRALAEQAGTMDRDLYTARIERDIEWVASESARDALMEAANLLTTIHAHLVTATAQVSSRVKSDPSLLPLLRNLEVGRKTAEAAAALTEGFFSSPSATPSATPSTSAITPAATPELGLQTPELRADFAQHQAQLAAHALTLAKAARELARHETLATKGLITARELDQARDDLAAATAEQSTLLRTTHTRWATRLRDEQSSLDTLLTEEKRLAEESHQTTVRAPVTGSVQGLTGLAPGAWLAAGQSVGTISPDDRLLIETFVPSRDVGLLRPGQAVHLQIDAYSYTQWGVLAGTVTAIAEDSGASSAAAGSTVYKVTILPAATALHLANGTTGTLRKGMTLSARFVVARRSVLQILYEDASAWLNPLEHTVTDRSSTTISSAFR
jgi:DNA-binding response OmpR family regulator